MEALAPVSQSSFVYVNDRASFLQACAVLSAYIQTPDAKLATDLETYIPSEALETAKRILGKDPVPAPIWTGKFWLGLTRLISVGTDPINAPFEFRNRQYVFDVHALGQELITAGLKPILESAFVLGHNLKYDTGFLRAQFGIKLNRRKTKCTQLFNQTLRAGNKSFGSRLFDCYRQHIPEGLFTLLTGKTFDEYESFKEKMQKSNWQAPTLSYDQVLYSAEDSLLLFYVYEKQLKLLQEWIDARETHQASGNSLANIIRMEFQMLSSCAMIEVRGAPFNAQRHEKLVIPLLEAKREEYKQILTSLPEFQVTPEPGTEKIIVKMDYLDAATNPVQAKDYSAQTRKLLGPLFKQVNFTAPVLDEAERSKLFGEFLSHTTKSYKGNPADLAAKKLAEHENNLKRPFIVETVNKIDGDETHILWRTTEPEISKTDMMAVLTQAGIPQGFEVLPYESVNLNSPDQLQWALFKRLGEPVDNTEAETLKQFMDDDPEAVTALLNYKSAKDYASKYGHGLVEKTTERGFIHCHVNQMGADREGVSTGRMSKSKPNLQNIPARHDILKSLEHPQGFSTALLFRASFQAPPGFILVGCDLSQIEPRITAEVTRDVRYIQALVNKEDLHALTAMACLNLSEPPAKGTFERDYIGKTMNLAISYGIGAKALADFMFKNTDGLVNWSVKEAQEMIDRYFDMYPGIRAKMDEIRRYVSYLPSQYGSLAPFKGHTPFASVQAACGRVRHFALTPKEERMEDYMLRADYNPSGKRYFWNEFKQRMSDCGLQGYNFLIQGQAASVFKQAALYVEDELEQLDLDPFIEGIVWLVHDEIGLLVREEKEDEAKTILYNGMMRAGNEALTVVPCSGSLKSGRTWAELK